MNPNVKGVLFNIFGGIVRCDEVAKGIIEATRTMEIKVPIVVRMSGTRAAEGREMLKGTNLIPAATAQEAAQKIIELVEARRDSRCRSLVDQGAPGSWCRASPAARAPSTQPADDGVRHPGGGRTSPRQGRDRCRTGVPVFNSVAEAVEKTGANTSIIFVPAPFAADAMIEAADAGVKLVVCITDGIPTLDMIRVVNYIEPKGVTPDRAQLPGPDQPRAGQGGHYAGRGVPGGADRGHLPQRHPDLRDLRPHHQGRAWGCPPASASAATPSSAPGSSMPSSCSGTTRRPRW